MRVAVAVAVAVLASPAQAQTGDGAGCAYTQCALNIAPRWNGLAVVRGTTEERVANLNFFWPRDISRAFDLNAEDGRAAMHARRAVRVRRIAAAMTDVSAAAMAVVIVRSWRRGPHDGDRVILGASIATFGASLPLQFLADGSLSRAVWWYNRRFAAVPAGSQGIHSVHR